MKKIIPLFLALGLGVTLSSCASINPSNELLDKANETITTYLVLTQNGLYNGEKGEDNPDLFLENVVTYTAEAGTELPGKDVITNTVSGVTFKTWVNYIGEGVPTGYTTVPTKNNTILYASWEHDGSSTPGTGGGEVSGETMRVYLNAPSWSTANIYYWPNGSDGPNAWPGVSMNKDQTTGLWYYDYVTTTYTNVIFNNGSSQTDNLVSPTSDTLDCYDLTTNSWKNDTDVTSGGGDVGGGDVGGGDENLYRVYFHAPSNWTEVNIYYWGMSNPVSWPGVSMTRDVDLLLWYYDYDTTTYGNVIFNNGSAQTADLLSPTGDDDTYHYDYDIWYNHNEVPEEPEIEYNYDFYLNPGPWEAASAWFAAYTWSDSVTGTFTKLEKVSNYLYGFNVPEGCTKVIFTRNNPAHSEPSFGSDGNPVWNQTGDLVLPTNGNNLYTITGWGATDGSWSTLSV